MNAYEAIALLFYNVIVYGIVYGIQMGVLFSQVYFYRKNTYLQLEINVMLIITYHNNIFSSRYLQN